MELTKKDKEFKWTIVIQGAFNRLKQAFTRVFILLTFNPKKPIIIKINALNYTLRAMLS
jgi:hypothetical protein